MDWIRISTNKIKIMLTAEDARRYDLHCENADYADVVTRQAFREILLDVQRETGFDATEDKVYIQMYPSQEGGCELFVTKIGVLLTEPESQKLPSPAPRASGKLPAAPLTRTGAFCFSQMADLLSVCRRLSAARYIGESEAWRDEDGRCWLLIREDGDPLTLREDYGFIREYGRMARVDSARLFLPEHGAPICVCNAVETLGTL